MGDDNPRRVNEPDDDSFSDALDDLFGSTQPEPASPVDAPQPPERPPNQPVSSYPVPVSGAPVPAQPAQHVEPGSQRSVVRWLGIGCASLLILTFACLLILGIIGAIFGEDTASGRTEPAPAVVRTY